MRLDSLGLTVILTSLSATQYTQEHTEADPAYGGVQLRSLRRPQEWQFAFVRWSPIITSGRRALRERPSPVRSLRPVLFARLFATGNAQLSARQEAMPSVPARQVSQKAIPCYQQGGLHLSSAQFWETPLPYCRCVWPPPKDSERGRYCGCRRDREENGFRPCR